MSIRIIVKNILLFITFVFFVAIILWAFQWFSSSLYGLFEKKISESQENFLASAKDIPISQKMLPSRNRQVEDLEIDATSAISVKTNLSSEERVLFKKSETKILPIASLSKLMTALVVLENYNLQQQIIITEADVLQEGEQGNLKIGQLLSIKNLLYVMLIESSNDAAYSLSEIMGQDKFIALMNIRSKNLGLINTYFADSSGLNFGSYSTAKDLVVLTKYLLNRYPLVLEIIGLKEYNLYLDNGEFHHRLINTNKLLGEIPEVIGGKTGFTNYAKGTFIIVEKSPQEGNYLINVVLGSDDRLEEMKKIINWLNAAYAW